MRGGERGEGMVVYVMYRFREASRKSREDLQRRGKRTRLGGKTEKTGLPEKEKSSLPCVPEKEEDLSLISILYIVIYSILYL